MPAPSGNFTPFYGVKFPTAWQNIINGIFLFLFPSARLCSQGRLTKLESPLIGEERPSEQSETPLVTFIKYSFMVMIMNNKSH